MTPASHKFGTSNLESKNGSIGPAPPKDFPIRQRVMHDLATRILSGRYAAGERLPIEAELISEYEVSRTALREAIRTLAAKGLIQSRKKAGTIVRPMQDWNMLDADVLEWVDKVDLGEDYLREISEARQIFEPKAARLAASRAEPVQLQEIADAFQEMERAKSLADWTVADLRFHQAILWGANNHVLAQLGSVLSVALRNLFRKTASNSKHFNHALEAHRAVFNAIENREPDKAEAAMLGVIADSNKTLAITNLVN